MDWQDVRLLRNRSDNSSGARFKPTVSLGHRGFLPVSIRHHQTSFVPESCLRHYLKSIVDPRFRKPVNTKYINNLRILLVRYIQVGSEFSTHLYKTVKSPQCVVSYNYTPIHFFILITMLVRWYVPFPLRSSSYPAPFFGWLFFK